MPRSQMIGMWYKLHFFSIFGLVCFLRDECICLVYNLKCYNLYRTARFVVMTTLGNWISVYCISRPTL